MARQGLLDWFFLQKKACYIQKDGPEAKIRRKNWQKPSKKGVFQPLLPAGWVWLKLCWHSTTRDAKRQQQTPTHTARHTQTPPVSVWVSEAASLCLLLSVGALCSLEISGGCLGDVWWVSGGIWVIFMDIGDAQMRLGASQSLQYGAVTLFWHSLEKPIFFSSDHTETPNIKMSICQLNKNGWVLPFFYFSKPVREKS